MDAACRRWARSTAGALAALTAAAALSAQDKDTVWTLVSGAGPVVTVSWHKNHPWNQALGARGAELVARYRAEGTREVVESIARVGVDIGADRRIRFRLPEDVRLNPMGPICLAIQLPDRRLLPVRRAGKEAADTAGFRYVAWEQQVRRRADARVAQQRVAAAERAVDVSRRSVATQQEVVAGRGWTTLASCDTVTGPAADAGVPPYDVVPPPEHDDVARRVCVHRIWYGRELVRRVLDESDREDLAGLSPARHQAEARRVLMGRFDIASLVPEAAGPYLAELQKALGAEHPTVRARRPQGDEFTRDWTRLSPTIASYKPHVGSESDYLGWPSTAAEAAFRIFGPDLARELKAEWAMAGVPEPTIRDIEGFIGASLDAYFGCVEDGRKQLATKYEAWRQRQAAAPQFAAAARDFLVRECRQEIGLLDRLKAEQAALEDQLARERAAATAASELPPLPSKEQPLNSIACGRTPASDR